MVAILYMSESRSGKDLAPGSSSANIYTEKIITCIRETADT